mmetsp:Transcript_71613/g.142107  ORF Transcript_71613/g.142107 Transcript_71613/m.142107 type:complete len:234 (+) Transcript_71613:58-759(+)|eukprot:CAMPEP_0172866634 /NCGR_PEP_ID=MMETSP1075-20121228/82098_1 /TAXON_ID=2916 /ORGANISM="Ceratium fusus, Strain PA161109" /LENGTH=233 /DNA_ID=CAMNT_0013715819 /DNA_START=49 /DNA_END=750 /DNA_ORIENTATION=-
MVVDLDEPEAHAGICRPKVQARRCPSMPSVGIGSSPGFREKPAGVRLEVDGSPLSRDPPFNRSWSAGPHPAQRALQSVWNWGCGPEGSLCCGHMVPDVFSVEVESDRKERHVKTFHWKAEEVGLEVATYMQCEEPWKSDLHLLQGGLRTHPWDLGFRSSNRESPRQCRPDDEAHADESVPEVVVPAEAEFGSPQQVEQSSWRPDWSKLPPPPSATFPLQAHRSDTLFPEDLKL